MNWTMPYPWRSRSDSVRRINMSSEPGNESFFCALRPIQRILSLRRRDYASQIQIGEPLAPQDDFGVLTRAGCESLWRALCIHMRFGSYDPCHPLIARAFIRSVAFRLENQPARQEVSAVGLSWQQGPLSPGAIAAALRPANG